MGIKGKKEWSLLSRTCGHFINGEICPDFYAREACEGKKKKKWGSKLLSS